VAFRPHISPRRQAYWSLNVDDLNKDVKARGEAHKRTLFFTETISQTQAPWI